MARTLFVADAHLRPGTPASDPDQLARWRHFFTTVAPGADRVVLLGDTFHLWFERGGRVVGDYAEALAVLADAARGEGAPKFYHVCGNRDFAMGAASPGGAAPDRWPGFFRGRDGDAPSALAAAGTEPRGPWHDFGQDGTRIRCIHGDAYCRRQYIFQTLRWLLAGPIGRNFFFWAPWWFVRALFGRMQSQPRRWFATLSDEEKALNARRIEQAPLTAAVDADVDLIVCGHLHQGFTRPIPTAGGRTGLLRAIPAFEDGWYAELADGEFAVRNLGMPIPANPSRPSLLGRIRGVFDAVRFWRAGRTRDDGPPSAV